MWLQNPMISADSNLTHTSPPFYRNSSKAHASKVASGPDVAPHVMSSCILHVAWPLCSSRYHRIVLVYFFLTAINFCSSIFESLRGARSLGLKVILPSRNGCICIWAYTNTLFEPLAPAGTTRGILLAVPRQALVEPCQLSHAYIRQISNCADVQRQCIPTRKGPPEQTSSAPSTLPSYEKSTWTWCAHAELLHMHAHLPSRVALYVGLLLSLSRPYKGVLEPRRQMRVTL